MPSQNLPTLDWNCCDRDTWNQMIAAAGRSSLEQSWAYGAAMHRFYGHTVDRAVIRRGDDVLAILQTFRKPVAHVATIIRIVRGPLWLAADTSAETQAAVYRAIRHSFLKRRREFLFWIPELTDAPENHRLMRAAGTRRMVTGLSSAWLDVSVDDATLRSNLAGSWRNALNGAERRDTKVRVSSDGHDLPGHMAVYDIFRRRKRFLGPPGGFVAAIGEAARETKDVMVLSALAGDDLIAGIVLLRHGISATYYVSWTSDEGRRRSAHNLLLWRGMRELRKTGTGWLDLGGFDTASALGLARFKLGLRPETYTLAGTFF